ncbi:hypothetical protein [Thauera sinica]|uniref:Uncharacterized protein n=1 Tax=Thauera sinica TaxID=2665146 RepID=A0ABW1APS8_9RHOO|nr:hypothetical protein [Thauera sp. K11]ATE62261.1 hypothetical protein CCZ27_21810 [Thauera sp. K11]
MRTLQVLMFMLCLLGGLYLLMQAPAFFMPDRWNPATGRQFDAAAARLLGAALLAIAAAGASYLRHFYYGERRRLPGPATQRRHFMLLLLALALLAVALVTAEPVANPDYRPPASRRP